MQGRRGAALAAGVAVAVAVVALAALLGGGSGAGRPIAGDAARLVPADALVYLHLSTDTGRPQTRAALSTARRFPDFAKLQRSILGRLSAPGCKVDLDTLRKGREAALALVNVGDGNAGSLILVDTGDTKPLRASACGEVQTEKIGHFYAIGQPQTMQVARELGRGRGRSLAVVPAFRRLQAQLPAGRVADAWVTRDGVRRLLSPQSGLLGVAGTLLDTPGLQSVAAALQPTHGGARLTVKTLRGGAAGGAPLHQFKPTLQDVVPAGSFAYLGLQGLTGAAGQLLGLVGSQAAGLGPVLQRAGKSLQPVLDLFKGEVGVSMIAQAPAPILTLVTRTKDPRAAAATLRAAQGPVARLLSRPGTAAATWTRQGDTFRLRPAPGIEFDYAVIGDLIAVSTAPSGIASMRNRGTRLPHSDAWRATIGNPPKTVTSLLFLDFSQLLRLGEQTGLNDSRAYLAVKPDLRRLKAVGAHTSSTGDETTAELDLSIP